MKNRLAQESSQYLQQHAENPVDWHPWGEEALAKARDEGKWIFLSIGYSSCHWCHVMERESFEDEAVAAYLNEHYVSIKVDREERPDIDAVYMEAVQMIAGHGGWPLNVWLTADLVPVYGGTYFPPVDMHHRPSFLTVLRRLTEIRHKEPEMVAERTQKMRAALEHELYDALPEAPVDQAAIDSAVADYSRRFDRQRGGFSGAPKFPQAMGIQFLLRESVLQHKPEAAAMALHSLRCMLRGGIWDALGGGLHRYSTDADWLVPHFEKMLYDQATLMGALALAQGFYPEPLFETAIHDLLEFLERELRDHTCGYRSAIDADTDGEEGATYVWTDAELAEALDPAELDLATAYYDLKPGGNWEGRHILTRPTPLAQLAEMLGEETPALETRVRSLRSKLFDVRQQKAQPAVDEKILASWNALLLESLVQTALYTGNSLARFMADLLRDTLAEGFHDGVMHRVRHGGRWTQPGFLDDYAFTASALLSHHALTGHEDSYRQGKDLVDWMIEYFYDKEHNAFWYSSLKHEQPVTRTREIFDNALPSGTSGAVAALLKAGRISGDRRYTDTALRCLNRLGPMAAEHGTAFGALLQSAQDAVGGTAELVIVGPDPEPFLAAWRLSQRPDVLPLWSGLPSEASPLFQGRDLKDGQTTAFLCTNGECRLPTTHAAELSALLSAK